MSVWDFLGSVDPAQERGRASPFFGTLEVGGHDALQMLSGFGWAVANRIGNDEMQKWMEEANVAEQEYGQEAISELPTSTQGLLNDPIGIGNFSWGRFGMQLLRNSPSIAAGGATAYFGGLPAAAVFGGAMTTGDAMSPIISTFQSLTDEEIAANPAFKEFVDQGMSSEQIKQAAITATVGDKDIASFAAGAALSLVAPETLGGRALAGRKMFPGMGRVAGAGAGAGLGFLSEGAEEAVPAIVQNLASEQTYGAVPETSVEQAALAGAILGGGPGAVAGGLSSGKQWEKVEAGQLDGGEAAALSGKPLPDQLALPPPDPNAPIVTPPPAKTPPLTGLPAPPQQLQIEGPREPAPASEVPEVIPQGGYSVIEVPPTSRRQVRRPPKAKPTVIEGEIVQPSENVTPGVTLAPEAVEEAIPTVPPPVEGSLVTQGRPRTRRPRVGATTPTPEIDVSTAPSITTPEMPETGRAQPTIIQDAAPEPAPLPQQRELTVGERFSSTPAALSSVSPEPIGYTKEGARILEAAPTLYDQQINAERTRTDTAGDTVQRKKYENTPFEGRTDLSVADIERRIVEDPQKAQAILEANMPTKDDYNDPAALVARLEHIIEQAEANDITLPKSVTKTTPNHMIWLRDVVRTVKALRKNLKNNDIRMQYGMNEMAARDGDFNSMRETFGGQAMLTGARTAETLDTLAGGTQSANIEEAEAAEDILQAAEETGEAVEEPTITQTVQPKAAQRAMTTSREYVYVTDEETGETKRVRNPVKKGYTVETTEEEKQRAIKETAPRAAALTKSRHDTPRKQYVEDKEEGQAGGDEGGTIVRRISEERKAKALPEGAPARLHPAKSAAAIAKSIAKQQREDAKAVAAANKKQAKKEVEKPPTKAALAKEVSAKRATERAQLKEQKATAKAQVAERKSKEPMFAPKETFTERQRRIFAEIAAARKPVKKGKGNVTPGVTLGAGISKGTASWLSYDSSTKTPDPEARAERSKQLAHTVDAKKIGDLWYKPTEKTTLNDIIQKVLDEVSNLPTEFGRLAKAVAERIRDVGDPDMEVLFFNDDDFDSVATNGVGSVTWRAFHRAGYVDQPPRIFIRDMIENIDELTYVYLHEAIHSVTSLELASSPRLIRLFNEVMLETGQSLEGRGNIWDKYGMTDEYEFLTEALSNPDFQKLLKQTKISAQLAGKLGLEGWRKATGWQAILAFIRRVMGWGPKEYTALEAAMSYFDRITLNRDDTMFTEYLRRLSDPAAQIENEFVDANIRVDTWERDFLATPRRGHGTTQTVNYKELNNEVNNNTVLNIARGVASNAAYKGGAFHRWSIKLRDMASLMRGYEHLFETGTLRRFVTAIMARYTSAQKMQALDATMMREKATLFDKYANKKIGSRSVQDVYENSLHDQSNWNVDASISLEQNTWLYDKKGGIGLKNHVSAAMHSGLKKEYDSLPADMKTYMKKEFKFYKDKHERIVDGILANTVLNAAEGKGLTRDAALKLGRRVVDGEATTADVDIIGKSAHDKIKSTPEFHAQRGPYVPQLRFGEFIVSGKVNIEPPKSGKYRRVTSPQSYIVDFYGADAEQQAKKFASNREEYSDISTVWTDAQGHAEINGEPFTAKDVVTGAVKSYRVTIQDSHVEFFETEKEADDAHTELKADKHYTVEKPVRIKSKEGMSYAQAATGSRQLQSILDELKDRDALAGLPPHLKREAMFAIQQAVYRAAPGTSISKRRMKRKHIAGSSKDSLRVMHSYATQANNYIAGIETAHELHEAYKPLAAHAEGGYSSSPISAQTVLDELNTRRNAQPGLYNASGPLVNTLTAVQFIDKLASPAYSIINATQIPMVTLPELAKKHGVFNAARALTKAMSDIGLGQIAKAGSADTSKAFMNRLDKATSYHDLVTKNNPNIKGNQVRMLDRLVEYGSLDPDSGFEASKTRDLGPSSRLLKYVEEVFRQAPRAVEAMNRYGTALAAYELYIKKGESHEVAVEYARDIVDSTQFNYSAANSSPIFNHPVGRVTLQFLKFGANMYQLLGSHVVNLVSKHSKKQDRIEAAKGLTYIIAAHVITAGFGGLPLEPFRLLVTMAAAAGLPLEWEDVELAVREVAADIVGPTLAEGLAKGLPRYIGVDVSNRMNLSDLLLPRPQVDLDERGGIGSYLMQMVGGATIGSAVDIFEGSQDIVNGNIGQGIGKVIPLKVFGDIETAVRQGTTGKKSLSGDPVLTYDIGNIITKAIGFRPAFEANVSERRAAVANRTKYKADQLRTLQLDFHNATPVQRTKMASRIRTYNEGVPYDQQTSFSKLQEYVREKLGRQSKAKGSIIPRGNEYIVDEILRTIPE